MDSLHDSIVGRVMVVLQKMHSSPQGDVSRDEDTLEEGMETDKDEEEKETEDSMAMDQVHEDRQRGSLVC